MTVPIKRRLLKNFKLRLHKIFKNQENYYNTSQKHTRTQLIWSEK